jgi:hypothetical protein
MWESRIFGNWACFHLQACWGRHNHQPVFCTFTFTSLDLFQRQQDTHTASLQSTASLDGQKSSASRASQPTLCHSPFWPTGYPVSVVRRPSPPTRDVSLSRNSSTPWPNYAEFNSPGHPPITLQLRDSLNASTAHWKQPTSATQTNIGQRHFSSSFYQSAQLLKR